ncbi:MAG TPA: serine hydrolase domain-containing protein [Pseudogracilibacillus sp.]|nr:serine hydrolase domain-containing protein [Pseudogracilibacillus sp.]
MIDKALDKAIEEFQQKYDIPGMAIQAVQAGEKVYEKYLGYQDVANKVDVGTETIFGVASLTKSVAALAILLLEEDGVLKVEDEVTTWLPELTAVQAHTTIHHLLTHTAGYPGLMSFHAARYPSIRADEDGRYLFGKVPESVEDVVTVEDMIEDMNQTEFTFIAAPGEIFNYSNESYGLLQAIVERGSGQSFEELVQERIFRPLQMSSAVFRLKDIPKKENCTEIYAYTKDEDRTVFHSPAWWASGEIFAPGALKANITDMMNYVTMLCNHGTFDGKSIISQASIEKMFTSYIMTPHGVQYGYGMLMGEMSGRKLVGHGGGIKGISSFMLIDQAKELAITVLTNIAEVPTEMIAVTVWEHLLQEGPNHEEVSYTKQATQGYQGIYESGEGQAIDVKAHQDGLQLTIAHEQLIAKQIDDHLFQLPDGKKIAFVLDGAEKVKGMHRGMRYLRKVSK